jgi:hypothetical protein
MSRLEGLDASSWEAFVASPAAVLVLGKSDCAACAQWTAELEAWLADSSRWPAVRFGKLFLDTPGLIGFKRANPWVAELDVLPSTQIYVAGERTKSFAGGGAARLETRLRRTVPDDGA